MKSDHLFQNKKDKREGWHCFTFLEISDIWFNRRQQKSLICFYILSVTIYCLCWSIRGKSGLTQIYSWKKKHLADPLKGFWGPPGSINHTWKMAGLQCRGFKCQSFEVRQTFYLNSIQFNMFCCVSLDNLLKW